MIPELRKKIDQIDLKLVELLAERLDLDRKISYEIDHSNEEWHPKTRAVEILDKVKLKADLLGLDEHYVTEIYQVILAKSRMD